MGVLGPRSFVGPFAISYALDVSRIWAGIKVCRFEYLIFFQKFKPTFIVWHVSFFFIFAGFPFFFFFWSERFSLCTERRFQNGAHLRIDSEFFSSQNCFECNVDFFYILSVFGMSYPVSVLSAMPFSYLNQNSTDSLNWINHKADFFQLIGVIYNFIPLDLYFI